MLKKAISKYSGMPIQVKASFWFLICSFLQKGISVITIPIITRLLSTTQYGQYNVFDSWLRIVTIFVTLQIYMGVYAQGLVKFSDDRRVFSSSLQGLTLFLTAGWTVIYIAFYRYWNNLFSLTTVQMLAMLTMIWASAAFGFWSNEQRVDYKYKKLVAVTLVVSLAKPLIGIVFIVLATDKVTAYILALAIVELVGYISLFFAQMLRGKKFYSKVYWRYALRFNLPLVPHYLSQTVLNNADRIMIKDIVGSSEAGIYSLAYSISLVMTLFNSALSQTLSPWMYQKIKDNKADEIASISYVALLLIAGVNLFVIAVAPEIVAIFAPKPYYDAIWIIPPVTISVFLMFCYDLFAKFEFYYEKTLFIMAASILGAALNVILNYVFIKKYGYYAAGYTTLFCYIVFVFAHYAFMKKICVDYLNGIKVYDFRILLVLFGVFLLIGFLLMATYRMPLLRYIIIVASMILIVIYRRIIFEKVSSIYEIKK